MDHHDEQRRRDEERRRAVAEHTAALNDLNDEFRRQRKLAELYVDRDVGAWRALADVMSGQITQRPPPPLSRRERIAGRLVRLRRWLRARVASRTQDCGSGVEREY